MTEPVLLAQMARQPLPGKVKTRLQPQLSPARSARLHAALVRHSAGILSAVQQAQLQLWVDGDRTDPLFRQLARELQLDIRVQPDGDLGTRMAAIVRQGLANFSAVILVGSDVPALSADYIAAAAAVLRRHPAVLGPAWDGGYVLLGLRCFAAELFCDIAWGQASVRADTEAVLRRLGWSWERLPALPDIDRPGDLRHLPPALQAIVAGSGP